MLVRGDKIIAIKDIDDCLNKGDIAKIIEMKNDGVVFAFGNDFTDMGFIKLSEFKEYFAENK